MRTAYPILISLALVGCSTAPKSVEHGIPNFRPVAAEARVYRGGQPQSLAAWAYLKSLGISNVVKLNLESEVSDADARAAGMTVSYFPINELHQFLLRPNGLTVSNAVAAIKPGTFVHCMEGHDRTGLIIACKRVWQDGWPKSDAWEEMVADGLDLRLKGLIRFWDEAVREAPYAAKERPDTSANVANTAAKPLPNLETTRLAGAKSVAAAKPVQKPKS
jgi:hypothetical protein